MKKKPRRYVLDARDFTYARAMIAASVAPTTHPTNK